MSCVEKNVIASGDMFRKQSAKGGACNQVFGEPPCSCLGVGRGDIYIYIYIDLHGEMSLFHCFLIFIAALMRNKTFK